MKHFLLVILFFTLTLRAATPGETGFLFLEEGADPQMAGVAAPGNAAYTQINPAAAAFARGSFTAVSVGQSWGDSRNGMLCAVWKSEQAFLGGSFFTQTITDIGLADDQGVMANSFLSSTGTALSLGGGINNQRGAVGIMVNGVEGRISTVAQYAVSFSGGAQYYILPGNLTFGIAAFHQGFATSMTNGGKDWHNDRLPRRASLGLMWHDTVHAIDYTVSADAVYYDLTRRVIVPVAGEVWVLPSFCIRAGSRLNHQTELLSAGFGLRLLPLLVDFKITVNRVSDEFENPSWLLGLTYSIGQPQ